MSHLLVKQGTGVGLRFCSLHCTGASIFEWLLLCWPTSVGFVLCWPHKRSRSNNENLAQCRLHRIPMTSVDRNLWFVRPTNRFWKHVQRRHTTTVMVIECGGMWTIIRKRYLVAATNCSRPSTSADCLQASQRIDRLLSRYGLTRHPAKGVTPFAGWRVNLYLETNGLGFRCDQIDTSGASYRHNRWCLRSADSEGDRLGGHGPNTSATSTAESTDGTKKKV